MLCKPRGMLRLSLDFARHSLQNSERVSQKNAEFLPTPVAAKCNLESLIGRMRTAPASMARRHETAEEL
jgi:hypothetical protein